MPRENKYKDENLLAHQALQYIQDNKPEVRSVDYLSSYLERIIKNFVIVRDDWIKSEEYRGAA